MKNGLLFFAALFFLCMLPANVFADGSPEALRTELENTDFYVQDGILYEFDTLKLASEGKLLTCFGLNCRA